MADKITMTKEQYEKIKNAIEKAHDIFDTILYMDYDGQYSYEGREAVKELEDIIIDDIIEIEDANGLL